MKAKLSSTSVKRLQAQEKSYEVFDLEIKGFLLRVQPTGRKTFYYIAGKRTRIKVGVLGLALTFAKARDLAASHAGKVAEGVDIQAEKMADRHEAREALNHTLASFLENHYNPGHWPTLKAANKPSILLSARSLITCPAPYQISKSNRWSDGEPKSSSLA